MLTLYDYYRSSAAYRVRIALNIKGIPYEKHSIHLLNNGGEQHSAEYQKINPLSLVPSLQDGNFTVSESLAIIEYLNEKYPSPPLLPNTVEERARVRSFSLMIIADTHPLCNLRVLNFLKKEYSLGDDQKMQWLQHWITTGLSALEKQLIANKQTGDFCFGDTVTLADICLIPQLYSAKRYECDLSPFPTLTKIDRHCAKISAFAEAYPAETVAS